MSITTLIESEARPSDATTSDLPPVALHAREHHALSDSADRRLGRVIAAVATAGMVTSFAVAMLSALGLLR